MAKGEAARKVCAPALGEEKAPAAFWEGGGRFDRSRLPGPLLELVGQFADGLGPAETPQTGDSARQP